MPSAAATSSSLMMGCALRRMEQSAYGSFPVSGHEEAERGLSEADPIARSRSSGVCSARTTGECSGECGAARRDGTALGCRPSSGQVVSSKRDVRRCQPCAMCTGAISSTASRTSSSAKPHVQERRSAAQSRRAGVAVVQAGGAPVMTGSSPRIRAVSGHRSLICRPAARREPRPTNLYSRSETEGI